MVVGLVPLLTISGLGLRKLGIASPLDFNNYPPFPYIFMFIVLFNYKQFGCFVDK